MGLKNFHQNSSLLCSLGCLNTKGSKEGTCLLYKYDKQLRLSQGETVLNWGLCKSFHVQPKLSFQPMIICAETGETWSFVDMDLYSNRVANYFRQQGFQVRQWTSDGLRYSASIFNVDSSDVFTSYCWLFGESDKRPFWFTQWCNLVFYFLVKRGLYAIL